MGRMPLSANITYTVANRARRPLGNPRIWLEVGQNADTALAMAKGASAAMHQKANDLERSRYGANDSLLPSSRTASTAEGRAATAPSSATTQPTSASISEPRIDRAVLGDRGALTTERSTRAT